MLAVTIAAAPVKPQDSDLPTASLGAFKRPASPANSYSDSPSPNSPPNSPSTSPSNSPFKKLKTAIGSYDLRAQISSFSMKTKFVLAPTEKDLDMPRPPRDFSETQSKVLPSQPSRRPLRQPPPQPAPQPSTTTTGKTPPSSNNLSAYGVRYLPRNLKLKAGSFDPSAILENSRLATTATELKNTAAVFEATRLTKDLSDDPIYGETGLSHILYQQVGGPINQVLAALGTGGSWVAKAGGPAPIEDWRLRVNHEPVAVLELKTSTALSSEAMSLITRKLSQFRMEDLRDSDATSKDSDATSKDRDAISPARPVRSLSAKFTDAKTRAGRPSTVLAMEQVSQNKSTPLTQIIAQMYTTQSNIGILTNADDWLVLELTSNASTANKADLDAFDEISVTHLKGTSPEGRSRVLDILLAVSLAAVPPTQPI